MSRASASAASSIRPPRAQLMIRTDGFIRAISRGADQVARLGRHRRVQRQEVAAAPEVVEPHHALDAVLERLVGGQERVEAEDRHAEPLRPLGHRQPDPSQADDAQRLAFELRARELGPFPLARLEAVVGLGARSAPGTSSKAMVCSAVEIVLPPGVFITTIPRRVAAATSMLSTPTPARTIALSRDWPSRTSAVSCVPERIAIPSASEERLAQAGRILGQLGVDHDLDPRLGTEPGEPFFRQLVGHQHAMRRHPRSPINHRSTRASVRLIGRVIRRHDYSVSDPWLDQPTATRALLADQDLLRGGDGPAGLDVVAELGERHLEGRQGADHVELVGVAHVADPDDLALELVLPADGRDAEPLGQLVADLRRPSGRRGRGRPSSPRPAWR